MSDDTYNGWTNYETWNWKLWMDDDEGSYDHWGKVTREVVEGADGDTPTYDLSKRLKEDCENMKDLMGIDVTGPFADILGAGLSRINWYEIAEHLVEDHE
jgi:hypothetical protein